LSDRFFMARGAIARRGQLVIMSVCCLTALAGVAQGKNDQRSAAQRGASTATQPVQEGTPDSWAQAAADSELKMKDAPRVVPLRYLQRKVDAKGDTTREVIESAQGNVARLIERNGQPITAQEDASERDRLKSDLQSSDNFEKHRKRDEDTRAEIMKLISLLPQAMIYSYTPGQPQMKHADGRQVVLNFHPKPSFRPPTLLANVLTGLAGRVWIDERSHCVTRIEANVLQPVNFGFGVVAKIFPGGTVALEQVPTVGDRWAYSRVDEDLVARVLMLKTIPEKGSITSWNFRRMNALLPYQEAIRMLLAMQVPLR
jgi:hypothetical protein